MKNRQRFKRIKGITFISPNTSTIEGLKLIEYKNDLRAKNILDKLIYSMQYSDNLNESVRIFSNEQSLKVWFYSDRKLAEIEYLSLINYVEKNK